MNRINSTNLLYAEPSFWEGFARILDIGGTFDDYNDFETEEEADMAALASDWYAVGADLYRAISRYPIQIGSITLNDE